MLQHSEVKKLTLFTYYNYLFRSQCGKSDVPNKAHPGFIWRTLKNHMFLHKDVNIDLAIELHEKLLVFLNTTVIVLQNGIKQDLHFYCSPWLKLKRT